MEPREILSQQNFESLHYALPAALLALTACVILLQDLTEDPGRRSGAPPFLAMFGLVAAGLCLFFRVPVQTKEIFSGMAVLDPFSWFFQMFFIVVGFLAVVLSIKSRELQDNRGEYFSLLIVLVLGMVMLASANDLLMVYLALETVSIVSYVLTGWKQHSRKSSEASLKYVLYGAVASGVMLYGLSLLYGMAGSTDFDAVADAITASPNMTMGATVAALMVFAGFGYKIASVPFHQWAPDVYEGAPTPVTAFLTVGPKAAGMAALIRFFYVVLSNPGDPAADGSTWDAIEAAQYWPALIGLIAIATMTAGNLSAIGQNNVKRLLGYSSIAHAGYMLMGLVCLTQVGLRSILFYLIVYCAMNIGAFVVVAAVSDETGSEDISAFRGLSKRHPIAAVTMAVFLFSLVGLPPLGGFVGKLHLFYGVVQAGLNVPGEGLNIYYILAIAGVLNSVVSLYYYARIAKAMFLEDVPEGATRSLVIEPVYVGMMAFLSVSTIVLGIYWGPFLAWADRSIYLLAGS
jgi:NADH-quinone oxidoreductase subunit N